MIGIFIFNAFSLGANTLVLPQNKHVLVVVVNKDSSIDTLSRGEVIDIYMGRYITFPDGKPARPLDLSPHSNHKTTFYKELVDRDEATISAYWARLLFSGRATPPENVATLEAMLSKLSTSVDTLGYIPIENVNDSLKVVFSFEDAQL